MRRIGLALTWLVAITALLVACSAPAQPQATPARPAAAPTALESKPAPTAAPAPAATTVAASVKPLDWPKKSINFIIPWPAGGTGDLAMRLLSTYLEKQLGVPLAIVNKAGAGSQTGTTDIAMSPPDGYTIGYLALPHVIAFYLDPERKAQFSRDSFELIAGHSQDPNLIAVKADSKYKTLKDLVNDAKARPGEIKVGTPGILSDKHLALMQFEKLAGVKLAAVHFDGAAPESTALLGGHIDAMFGIVGQTKMGEFRNLALLDNQRSIYYPDIPTAEEQGYKLYSAADRLLAAPKGTPKEIVRATAQAVEQVMKDPEHVSKAKQMEIGLRYRGPDEISKRWADIESETKPVMDVWFTTQKK